MAEITTSTDLSIKDLQDKGKIKTNIIPGTGMSDFLNNWTAANNDIKDKGTYLTDIRFIKVNAKFFKLSKRKQKKVIAKKSSITLTNAYPSGFSDTFSLITTE